MPRAPIDVYADGFVGRYALHTGPDDSVLEAPGTRGIVSSSDGPLIRLLVTDDRAYDLLATLIPDVRAGMVTVFEAASRCDDLLRREAEWKARRPATAMVCRDLQALPRPSLPGGLTLRPVRLGDDAPNGVSLEDAVALAVLADPGISEPPETFADFLRSLPPVVQLFAAIDNSGAVLATSGSRVFGQDASVFFVNTEPSWRGRGIGRAMTAAALHAAQVSGARRASLDATVGAAPIYARLGFEDAGRITRFFRAP